MVSPATIIVSTWAFGLIGGTWLRRRPADGPAAALLRGLAIAPFVGPGLLSATWFMTLATGLDGRLAPVIACGALICLRLGNSEARKDATVTEPDAVRWAALPLAAGALITALSCLLDSVNPDGESDAMAIWNFAARYLHRTGADYRELIGAIDPSHHLDYPILIPAAVAAQWTFAGAESPAITAWTHAGFLLPTAALYHECARFRLPARTAALAATALTLLPASLLWSQRQYADSHLAYAVAGAVLGLGSRIGPVRERMDGVTCGVLLGACPFLKNEGIPLVLAALALALFGARRGRGKIGLPAMLLGALPFGVALAIFKLDWAPINDLVERGPRTAIAFLTDGERWAFVARAFLRELDPTIALSRRRWGPLLLVTAFLVIGGAIRRIRGADSYMRLMGRFVALSSLGWFLVYVLTPQDLDWHTRTSLDRLVLQLTPAFFLIGVQAWAPAHFETTESGRATTI